ncbi:MAG: hypothetical protein JXQ75_11640 [Phycisphaerae bacterium]|nr:hypothetical protein [Phycisphaerae bacterium]
MIRRWIAGVLLTIVLGAGVKAGADEPDAGDVLPSGFTPHLRSVSGGQVDWANGCIIAEGTGNAHGRTNQDRLMAKRAATVVAARNALAVAMGVQVDGDGRFADVRDGEVHLRGVVKGHETVSVDWRPNKTPPECIVTLRVPLWGVKGVASVVYTAQVQKAFTGGRERLALVTAGEDVADDVLVIDARGTGVLPCMFPVVARSDGAVVYDVGTIAHHQGQDPPPVRYAETAMSYEQLRACLDVEGNGVRGADVLAGRGKTVAPASRRWFSRSGTVFPNCCFPFYHGLLALRQRSTDGSRRDATGSLAARDHWRTSRQWHPVTSAIHHTSCVEGLVAGGGGGAAAWATVPGAEATDGGWFMCSPADETQSEGQARRGGAASQPTSRPASQPTSKPDRTSRRRQRRVVKAVKAVGRSKTEIVLTKEDADKLRNDPDGAGLLRSGRVIVVVDSVAAGIEGQRDDGSRDRVLALSK